MTLVLRSTLAALALTLVAGAAHALPQEGEWARGRFEIGPRLTTLALYDTDTFEELGMGGVGGYVRYRISRRLGIEGGLDILAADEMAYEAPGDVMRVTVPLTASGMFYLFPDWRLQIYGLAGAGIAGHSVSFEALGENMAFATPVLQLGMGAQYRFETWRLDVSMRSLYMRRDAEDVEVTPIESWQGPGKEVAYQPYTGDRNLHGAMLNVGIHWGF